MELAQVEGNLRKKVKDIFLNTVPRYHAHTLKVVTNMKRMMKEIDDPQDKTILLLAAYLHDMGYSVPYRGDYVGNINHQAAKVRLDSEAGAELSKEVLRSLEKDLDLVRCLREKEDCLRSGECLASKFMAEDPGKFSGSLSQDYR